MAGDVAVREEQVPQAVSGGPELSHADMAALREAVRVLERSTLVGRLSAMAGRPLDIVGRNLPAPVGAVVARATDKALRAALHVALRTVAKGEGGLADRVPTRLAAVAAGALGGALGPLTLPVELPVSTVLMLRSILEIARREGEDVHDPAVALACLEVFALGSRTEGDEITGSGYFAVRSALARSVGEAAKIVAGRGVADKGAPALVRFLSAIASRFGAVVSQKIAAGAVPILGALGGAVVNTAFLDHFRAMAGGHFTVRRLERTYGAERVQAAYEAVRAELA